MPGRIPDRWQAIAPGRVNLIGEHTDYNGLPVLPIAIDRDVRIEFTVVDDGAVRLDSPVPRFAPFEFQLKRPIEAADQGEWSNYVRAAARGLREHGVELRRGIEGTVTSDVPIASGLSSSSALVVASTLALLKANGVEVGAVSGLEGHPAARAEPALSRLELAALMARAERFVGLQGGGMDQAACLHGEEGHALRIDFDPLRVRPVAIPEGWRWVVASSLVRAEKSAGAREAYNERARECREALAVVARPSESYRDLVADNDADRLLDRARRALTPVLFRRFRHVVTEGRRVAFAEEAMRDGDMGRFGKLMMRSHESPPGRLRCEHHGAGRNRRDRARGRSRGCKADRGGVRGLCRGAVRHVHLRARDGSPRRALLRAAPVRAADYGRDVRREAERRGTGGGGLRRNYHC